MDYMQMFKGLSDAAILFVGSAAIIGLGALSFGGLVWVYIWAGKHLVRYIRKVSAELRESISAPEPNGKRVRT